MRSVLHVYHTPRELCSLVVHLNTKEKRGEEEKLLSVTKGKHFYLAVSFIPE